MTWLIAILSALVPAILGAAALLESLDKARERGRRAERHQRWREPWDLSDHEPGATTAWAAIAAGLFILSGALATLAASQP
jgi:hypothetical protein